VVYFHYCLISVNIMLFVVRCYSFLVVSGALKMGTESVSEMLERL